MGGGDNDGKMLISMSGRLFGTIVLPVAICLTFACRYTLRTKSRSVKLTSNHSDR